MTYAAILAAREKKKAKEPKIIKKGPKHHEVALAQGKVVAQSRLRGIKLPNGKVIRPTEGGFFVADTPEAERMLKKLARNKHVMSLVKKEPSDG